MNAASILTNAGMISSEPPIQPLPELTTIRVHRPAGSTGEQGRDFFYAMVARQAAELATVWHAWSQPKPFSIVLEPDNYRVTIWDGRLLAAFVRQVRPTASQVGITPFASLAEHRVQLRYQLDLVSPFAVRRAGLWDVLPSPVRDLQVLRRRLLLAGQECPELDDLADVLVPYAALRTVTVPLNDRQRASGSVGRVTFDVTRLRHEQQRTIGTLLHFAEYAGLGSHTTAGMGDVRIGG